MQEFINLKQGNMGIKKYPLKFTELARYFPSMLVDSKAHMNKFAPGVSKVVVKECWTTMLVKEMDITKLMVHAQQIKEEKVKEKERESMRVRTGSTTWNLVGTTYFRILMESLRYLTSTGHDIMHGMLKFEDLGLWEAMLELNQDTNQNLSRI